MWKLGSPPSSVALRRLLFSWFVVVALLTVTVTGAGVVAADRNTQGDTAGIPVGYRYMGPGEPDAPPMFTYDYLTSPQETVRYPGDPAFSVSGTPGATDGCAYDGTVHVSKGGIWVGSCFSLEMPRVELDDWALYVAWGEGTSPWLFSGTIVEAIAWDWDTGAWAAATVVFDPAGTFHVHTTSSDVEVMDAVEAAVSTADGWWGVTLDQALGQPAMAGGVLDPLGTLEAWGDVAAVDTPNGRSAGVGVAWGKEHDDGPFYAPRASVEASTRALLPCDNLPALLCEELWFNGPAVPVPESPPVDNSQIPSGGTAVVAGLQSAEAGDGVFPVYRRSPGGDLGLGANSPVWVCTPSWEFGTECEWLA